MQNPSSEVHVFSGCQPQSDYCTTTDFLLGIGVYSLSDEAQQYAKQFDELPEEKKKLAMAYMGVVKAQ